MRHPILGKLGLIFGGTIFALALLCTVEFGLRKTFPNESVKYDPFAGFANLVPVFLPTESVQGERVYRTSRAHHARSQEEFRFQKPENGFRAFVIGGSSAAGTPYTYEYAFASWLEHRLRATYLNSPIEIVNAAMPGYASRRLVAVTKEIVQYDPDLVIIYAGHNELVERRHYEHLLNRNPLLFRIEVAFARTHLFQFVRERLGISPTQKVPRIEFKPVDVNQMFAVGYDWLASVKSSRFERDLEFAEIHYRHNLNTIIETVRRSGAEVALMTLSQNFVDWEPGSSRHPPSFTKHDQRRWHKSFNAGLRHAESDCQTALEIWKTTLELDPGFAKLHWEIARCYRTLGQLDDARRHYRLASDLDAIPHGAPLKYNQILRELSRQHDTILVDVEQLLETHAEDRLVGNNLFIDLIHPNLKAHMLIAERLAESLMEAGLPAHAKPPTTVDYRPSNIAGLYRANPNLFVEEQLVLAVACAISRRLDCNTRALDEVLRVDPTNRPRRLRTKPCVAVRKGGQGK